MPTATLDSSQCPAVENIRAVLYFAGQSLVKTPAFG